MLAGRLEALVVEQRREPGYYGDGGGLSLQVSHQGVDERDKPRIAKSWIFRFRLHGRLSKNGKPVSREMGLGPYPDVTLDEARTRAADCRRLCRAGIDPIEARDEARAKMAVEAAQAKTFKECAIEYMKSHRNGWRNAKHAAQWESTLKTYAYPIIGYLKVRAVDTAFVKQVLDPIWLTKPETASRLRQRIELVLDYAKANNLRDGENPARWRGHLSMMYLAPAKVRPVQHHPSMEYVKVGAFIARLRQETCVAARCLELTVLTAVRTGDAIGAKLDQFDFDEKLWRIPRTKNGKPLRVPLAPRALAIMKQMAAQRDADERADDFMFPGDVPGKGFSNNAMLKLLERMGVRDEAVTHGFRATFKTWATEETRHAREVIELSIAHTVTNKVEAAYLRGDLLVKRRKLMDDWERFCGTIGRVGGTVAHLHRQVS